MLVVGKGNAELVQDILKFDLFGSKLGFLEIPGHFPKRQIVLADITPDLPSLFIVPRPYSEVSLKELPLLVGHEEKGTVHSEPFSCGYCCHCHRENFIEVQGRLEDHV